MDVEPDVLRDQVKITYTIGHYGAPRPARLLGGPCVLSLAPWAGSIFGIDTGGGQGVEGRWAGDSLSEICAMSYLTHMPPVIHPTISVHIACILL